MGNELDTTFSECPHGSPRCDACGNKRVIEWIKTDSETRLQNDTLVLITTCLLYKDIKTAHYYNGAFISADEDVTKWVTHWADISRIWPS